MFLRRSRGVSALRWRHWAGRAPHERRRHGALSYSGGARARGASAMGAVRKATSASASASPASAVAGAGALCVLSAVVAKASFAGGVVDAASSTPEGDPEIDFRGAESASGGAQSGPGGAKGGSNGTGAGMEENEGEEVEGNSNTFFSKFSLSDFLSTSSTPSSSDGASHADDVAAPCDDGKEPSAGTATTRAHAPSGRTTKTLRELALGSTQKKHQSKQTTDAKGYVLAVEVQGHNYRLATWRQRFVAHMYNAIIMLGRQVLLIGVPALVLRFLAGGSARKSLDTAVSGLATLGLIAYQGAFELAVDSTDAWITWAWHGGSKNGQNLGMRWAGIRLVREDGRPVDSQTMMWWWLGWMLAPVNIIAGAIDARRQSLDNHLSGTYTVQDSDL